MKIPETYEEYLKTPKSELAKIVLSDALTFEQMLKLYQFNKLAINERKSLPVNESAVHDKNTLWEELRGNI